MIFNSIRESEEEENLLDSVAAGAIDPSSPEGIEAAAAEVETHMTTAAMEALTYFDNGEEAIKNFTESTEVRALVEARKIPKKTYVRLNKSDDLNRRTHLACLVLAKNNNDSLWKKLALNRVKERKLRNAIYKKYSTRAQLVARKSQLVHQKNARKLPALPKIQY